MDPSIAASEYLVHAPIDADEGVMGHRSHRPLTVVLVSLGIHPCASPCSIPLRCRQAEEHRVPGSKSSLGGRLGLARGLASRVATGPRATHRQAAVHNSHHEERPAGRNARVIVQRGTSRLDARDPADRWRRRFARRLLGGAVERLAVLFGEVLGELRVLGASRSGLLGQSRSERTHSASSRPWRAAGRL